MKNIIFFLLISMSFSSGSSELQIRAELKEVKLKSARVYKALVKKMFGAKKAYRNIDNTKKWFAGKLTQKKANVCLGALLSSKYGKLSNDVSQIYAQFIGLPSIKFGYKRDFSKLMEERNLRRKLMAFDELGFLGKKKICEEIGIDVSDINMAARSNIKNKSIDDKYSYMHPNDRKILKSLEGKFGENTDVMKIFLTKFLPSIIEKARVEFIPRFKQNCPGTIEEYWPRCENKDGYFNALSEDVPKMYCMLDHKEEIGESCFK